MADIPDLSDGEFSIPKNSTSQEVVASLKSSKIPQAPGLANLPVAVPTPMAVQPGYVGHQTPEGFSLLDAVPVAAGDYEQTIQIAPHPTTNRFPWTPIDNPRVPIMPPPMATPDPEPLPAAQPLPRPQPMPVALPPAPVPPSVPVPPVPEPAIKLPLTVAVAPPIQVTSPPIAVAPAPAYTVPPPIAAAPIPMQPVAGTEPMAILDGVPPAAEPSKLPAKHAPARKPALIYSDYTREVWHVFRPNRLIRVMLLGFILLIVIGAVVIWLLSGAPTDFQNIPFLKHILRAE